MTPTSYDVGQWFLTPIGRFKILSKRTREDGLTDYFVQWDQSQERAKQVLSYEVFSGMAKFTVANGG